jgi:hypothetical protein
VGGIPDCRALKQAALHLLTLPCQGLLFPQIRFVRRALISVTSNYLSLLILQCYVVQLF